MDRLFKRTSYATVTYLSKLWDFKIDPEDKGVTEKWFASFPKDTRKMMVPSCWNTEFDLFRYRGVAWYSTTFEIGSPNIYLNFDAVQNEADVYLDGVHLGNHYGGFLAFGYEVNGLALGEHTLTVRVNNELNSIDTLPGKLLDWYNYGGIARGVYVRELSDAWIRDYKISYELENNLSDARVSISAKIKTFCEMDGEFTVYVNDGLVYTEPIKISGDEEIKCEFQLKDVRLWRIYKPNLYTVRLAYGKEDIYERIGFREIKTSGRDIFLNGEKIKILGVNRHEEHPDFGFSMPFNLIKRDIDIAKDMNCNAIRTSHYPNSKKTADYCDEIGMLFWSEIPMWNISVEATVNPKTVERALSMEREMILENYHHPSIIFWGMHNECATDTEEVFALTERMVKLAKSLDTSRLITYASNKTKLDTRREICFSLADVVSVNHYIGWYFPVENGDWNDFMQEYEDVLMSCNSCDKPFIMSEFGYAALLGTNSFDYSRWTEDYQADALEFTLGQILGNEKISGGYIWQFADMHSEQNDISRPRCCNNKGILDEYRRPKRAYRVVRKIYGEHLGGVKPQYKTTLFGYKHKEEK